MCICVFFFVYVALVMKDVYMRRFFFCIGSIGGVRIE